jgi:hypothetical protein
MLLGLAFKSLFEKEKQEPTILENIAHLFQEGEDVFFEEETEDEDFIMLNPLPTAEEIQMAINNQYSIERAEEVAKMAEAQFLKEHLVAINNNISRLTPIPILTEQENEISESTTREQNRLRN